MRILITGGSGLLGTALSRTVPHGQELSTPDVDIRNIDSVDRAFQRFIPDVVIHTAAIGSVDYAESHRQGAWVTNVQGTCNVIQACKSAGAKLVFISSNAVFGGKDAPYSESDTVNPINYYGKLKVEGEELVNSSGLTSAIIRPILMYGWNDPNERQNPATWAISELKAGRPISAVTDIYYNPLFVGECARAVWAVLMLEKTGIFHIGGKDRVSLFTLLQMAASIFELDASLITPVKNSFFKDIAPRPKDTTYVTKKMQMELGVKPVGIRDGLLAMRRQG